MSNEHFSFSIPLYSISLCTISWDHKITFQFLLKIEHILTAVKSKYIYIYIWQFCTHFVWFRKYDHNCLIAHTTAWHSCSCQQHCTPSNEHGVACGYIYIINKTWKHFLPSPEAKWTGLYTLILSKILKQRGHIQNRLLRINLWL